MSNNEKPKPLDLVPLLINKKEDFLKDIRNGSSRAIRINIKHSVREYPTNEICKYVGMVFIEKGTGLTRSYRHLVSCLGDGNETHLFELYSKHLSTLKSRNNNSCFRKRESFVWAFIIDC